MTRKKDLIDFVSVSNYVIEIKARYVWWLLWASLFLWNFNVWADYVREGIIMKEALKEKHGVILSNVDIGFMKDNQWANDMCKVIFRR